MVDTTAADALLKDFYLGPVRDQLNSEALLMRRLQKNEEIVEGRKIVMSIRTGRTAGILAVPEGGTLPGADQQRYKNPEHEVVYNYGTIEITGPAIASARTERGAFMRIVDSEIKGMVMDFKHDLNRQMWGDGSGRIAVASGVKSGATIPVQYVWDSGNQAPDFRHIQVGDRLALEDFSAGGNPVKIVTASTGYEAVTAIDIANKIVTFGASVDATVAAGDGLVKGPNTTDAISATNTNYRGQSGGAALAQKEMMGMVGLCSGTNGFPRAGAGGYTAVTAGKVYAGSNSGTAVFANVMGLDDNVWRGNTFFNGGVPRSLNADLIQRALDTIEVVGQATPTAGFCSYGVRRSLVSALVADRRYVNANTYMLDGGFQAVDFNGIPIIVEKDCPEGCLFLADEDHLMIARMSDFYWLDKDGSIWDRVSGTDKWQATLAYYAELVSDRRNALGVIGDILIS